MGTNRHLSKKIRDTKETFHSKIDTIKERKGKDLTKAEETNKGRQEYTEELYKKGIHDQYNHDGMVTHLQPDILECEVKWALGSITTSNASGSGGIPADLFQILKVWHSICQVIWKTQQLSQDSKRSVFVPIPKKRQCQRMFKLLYNCTHLIR